MNYEKAYKELKSFCEKLYDRVYCDTCGADKEENEEGYSDCEDCYRKRMGWCFPKNIIEDIENER